jgi:hypothetical protein
MACGCSLIFAMSEDGKSDPEEVEVRIAKWMELEKHD